VNGFQVDPRTGKFKNITSEERWEGTSTANGTERDMISEPRRPSTGRAKISQ
jgi:hypothetical protein